MSVLYLHIGGPKTGSTYLQSIFRMNRSALLDSGIHYPAGQEYQDASPTSWTSGNGGGILESSDAFSKALEEHLKYPHHALLYSHELLRNDIYLPEKVSFIPGIAREHGFSRIKVLFFVRDPVAYAVSVWQQLVKNNGMADTLDDRIMDPKYMMHNYKTTQDILELLAVNEMFELTARNYSRCTDKLFDIVSAWLGISGNSLVIPQATRINRSLTRAELTLQQAMNRVLGGDAKIVARALTENLTDIRPEKMAPSPHAQQVLWDRIEPMVIRANKHLPPGHEIIFDRQEPEAQISDSFTFSADQLEIIGKVVAEEIRDLRYPYIPPRTDKPTLASGIWDKIKALIHK